MASTAKGANPDLMKERAAATFPSDQLTYIWDGCQENTLRRRHVEKLVFDDRDFDGPDSRQLDREEQYLESCRKHVLLWKKMKKENLTNDIDRSALFGAVFGADASGLSMHEVAFEPMFRLQASDEQLRKWMPLVDSYQVIGCYAQTEIGHGTFVRGLETTAVYDVSTKEFVLNTPTLSSTKWWIGSLGKSSNYTILMAQLSSGGKRHGLHAFLLPIRDRNYEPLPGITVGDIGPKFGSGSIDNGFLRLKNVRIPRENMLMRYAKVLEDGTYIKPANEKIMYGGMLGIRANLPIQISTSLAMAITIAIRYSCVRHQSELKPNSSEPQILDFQTQQHKLFPLLALCYAYRFAAFAMRDLFQDVMVEVQNGNYQRLIEAHALSSGLKAVTTRRGSWGVEMCRLACGGHGYLLASGLPTLYVSMVAAVTAEGEATVLLLQTARYLMKNCLYAQSNKRIDAFMLYLDPNNVLSTKFKGAFDPRSLLEAYEFRAARVAVKIATHLQSLVAGGNCSQEEAWNQSSVQLVGAALAHVDYVIMRTFVEGIERLRCPPSVHRALTTLCTLHGIHGLIENAGLLLQEGYLTGVDLDSLRVKELDLYGQVRVDAVAYVDAFDFDDRILCSTLGRFDGNVYESLYEWAISSKLNEREVHKSFTEYMKPLQTMATSKL